MYKKYFHEFLTANKGKLHFAAHSHHYWPDVTKEAQQQYWLDSAKYVDDKWSYFFETTYPNLQKNISKILNLSNPEQITFAPNTHELTYRLLSCFDKGAKILTTDSEFYSFDRQVNRLSEAGVFKVNKIQFNEDFITEANTNQYDLIFISQVFFNSGFAISDLTSFVKSLKTDATIVIDAYHGFMAIPTDLSEVENRIFYMAGGYKYCGSGEGSCFLVSPKETTLTPKNTGWFAQMGNLTNFSGKGVPFSDDGFRFAGSTMDYSALYRMNAVLNLWENERITVEAIHAHVNCNQKLFLEGIKDNALIKKVVDCEDRGHFIAFEFETPEACEAYSKELDKNNVKVDYRRNILRFGFSIYQDNGDIMDLINIIKNMD